ncbi:MAG: hypothetical protein HC936_18595 [Leptolyngbyaceae cyanobacterium SU_3_3]|nr:hypothetical protein [Leptolyngbyaceae cyanobacterium SU_3_3]
MPNAVGLGRSMICKPARGSGASGVMLDFDGSLAALDTARDYDTDDDFLIQELIP